MTRAPTKYTHWYTCWGKRLGDVLVSGSALLVLAPLFALVALLVKLDSSGPIIFTQKRLGRNGKCFDIYKFRTMTNKQRVPEREIIGHDIEVTRVGYWLRRYKIDELPQLLNVLKGDMSIVGPRPGLPAQLAEFDENGKKRILVRPGLTGLAQVNGNVYLSWPERWRYDALYVDNLSPWLDLRILYRTFLVVIRGEEYFSHKPSKEKKEKRF